ncbi:hypothetical protein GYMLUDRAFT_64846 [Collybiopsis luxurians FD-317 M1]|uniref:Uncharacterized protein n=1 Tax=Collybiopsis luxurians FD-317 M1 TaxID=944289 RepID=A0A0D0BP98_9AGAR|nr:hypothetical protein GYMLUDRAFT_64846 [Collybiopsis luxurians FD-317 M1]
MPSSPVTLDHGHVDIMFPTKGYTGRITATTYYLSRRISIGKLSWNAVKQVSWARIRVLLLFVDSWSFLFTSSMLLFGIGLESNKIVCAMALYTCVMFYATSKALIYFFLIERVYVVWTPNIGGEGRLRSPIYILCMIVVAFYGVVAALMAVGRVHYLRENDGACIIGLKAYTSYVLLSYDLTIIIVLTLMLLWPLVRAELSNDRLKKLARKTLVACVVALATSSMNVLVMAILKGHERGWLCLGSCSIDVRIERLLQRILLIIRDVTGLVVSTASQVKFGRSLETTYDGMEMQPTQTRDVSVTELFRTSTDSTGRPGVQITVTTDTVREGSIKKQYFRVEEPQSDSERK